MGGQSGDRNPADAIGSRREARETALGVLYAADSRGSDPLEVLADQPVQHEDYTIELVEGVAEHIVEIDELIDRFAEGWRTDRMPRVDLSLVRMAVFELGYRADVPTSAVLAEVVALVADYSTEHSGRFVNGLVSRIAEELRPGT